MKKLFTAGIMSVVFVLLGAGCASTQSQEVSLENMSEQEVEVVKLNATQEAVADVRLDTLKKLFSEKYNKRDADIRVSIATEAVNHVSGSVSFSPFGPGDSGAFLAATVNGEWKIVHDGQDAPFCTTLQPYNFPADMIAGCAIESVAPVSTTNALKQAFATKYKKSVQDITVTIGKEVAGHVQGGVTFAPGGPGNGGAFMAAKVNGDWKIVHDGQDAVLCSVLKQYNFPTDMSAGCVKEESAPVISTTVALKQAFAAKYNSKLETMLLTLSKETSTHAQGSVTLAPGPGNSGVFFAAKVNGNWKIVHDGQDAPLCSALTSYNFPSDMMTGCAE